jgi:hypothetical protein
VGAGGAHGIARFPFTEAKVSQASNRLRFARAWPPAMGEHLSWRQTPHLICSAKPARRHNAISSLLRVSRSSAERTKLSMPSSKPTRAWAARTALRHHIDLARAWPSAIREHRSWR